jgi:anti-anti-sigma regulatory factor
MINIPTEIYLRNATAVAQWLAEQLDIDASVTVAGEQLLGADAAGIQVLLAAHNTAIARNVQFTVTYARDGALHQALRGLGLCDAAGALAIANHPFIEIEAAA